MKIRLQVDAPIPITEHVANVTFDPRVMVSLDCCGCRRCWRSVVLDANAELSYCTPTRHPFNGRVVAFHSISSEEGRVVTGRYVIEYEFLDFEDSKYPMRMPKPGATWARVTCSLQCGCGLHIVHETQNNQGRPFNVACECGVVLVTEIEEIPKIQELF